MNLAAVIVHSLEYTVGIQSLPAWDSCDGVDGPLPIQRLQHVYRQLVFISSSLWEAVTGRHECCGDNKAQQKEYAWKLKKQTLEKGDAIAMYFHKMMAVKWQDTKPFTILTAVHDNVGIVDTGKTSWKMGTSPETKASTLL